MNNEISLFAISNYSFFFKYMRAVPAVSNIFCFNRRQLFLTEFQTDPFEGSLERERERERETQNAGFLGNIIERVSR